MNTVKNSEIINLFGEIDFIDKNNKQNDNIISRVRYLFIDRLNSYMNKKKMKKRLILDYKIQLKKFDSIIKKQISTLEKIILSHENENQGDEVTYTLLKMKKEILDYSLQMYKYDLYIEDEEISEEEKRIYQHIKLYDVLGSYCDDNSLFSKEVEKCDIEMIQEEWKKYYFLILYLEKQNDYNKIIVSSFLNQDFKDDEENIYRKKCEYDVADFQGQFSKSVYCQRKRLQLTQSQLQKRTGIDRTMISKIERVQQPTTIETAMKILSALGLGIAIYPFYEKEKMFE